MYAPRTALPLNDAYEKYEQYTQELRVTSPAGCDVTYVAGLYFFYKDFTDHFTRYIDLYGIDFARPNSGALSVLNDTDASNQSAAVFGQMTWNMSRTQPPRCWARATTTTRLTHKQTVSAIPGTLPEAPPGSIDAKTDDQGGSGA